MVVAVLILPPGRRHIDFPSVHRQTGRHVLTAWRIASLQESVEQCVGYPLQCVSQRRCERDEKIDIRAAVNCGPLRERPACADIDDERRSEEHTSELQSLMRNAYAVFC